MMENQQLIKKDRSANSYSKIFPWTFTDLVLDRVTKESLDNILVRNNFIALPYVGSKAATRLQVPMKNRRRGIWLSYIDYAGTLTVEYYNDNNLDDNHWQDSSHWLPYNTAEFQPASVGLSELAQEVFDWINSQITAAVKLNPEDLQKNSSGQIEEANRAYDTSTFSGLGYRILRKNIQSNKNVLTQSMINMPNNVYKIRYDFDLNGATINLPANSVLQFVGGSIKNGTLNGNNTVIEADSNAVIFDSVVIEGTWNVEHIYDSWFAFNTSPSYVSNQIITNILALSNDDVYNTIHFDADRTYYFENTYKGKTNLGDDVRPDYWKLNTSNYDFLRIFTGFTSNTHLIVNNTIQMLPTNQGAYFVFHIEGKSNIEISGTGTINADAKDHLYTDPFAGTDYYGEWGHVFNFRSCDNIVIRDITVGYAFGDALAFSNIAYNNNGTKAAGPATKNVLIDGVKVLYARRNGITLGGNNYTITNVYFEGCGSDEIKGTAPMAGIDFENDYTEVEPSGVCSNVSMSSCKFKNNKYDISSTIRDDLGPVPRGQLVTINDCNFTAPLRLNRTNGLTFNTCHIKGISSHDNSISPWYASKDLIFNNCVFDELNPYLPISAEEQNKKFINPTYPEDIKYSTTFQQSLAAGRALKFTIPKPLVGLVEFTAFCSNPNYSAIQMPINITEYTFGNSQRLTGIRDIKIKAAQDNTLRYAIYRNVPVFSYINYAEDADNFNIYFAIGGDLISNPLGGNTSVNIFLTSKTKFIVVEAPVSENPGVAGMYGGKWSTLSAITKSVIDVTAIPSSVTFPSKEMFPANMLADLPTSLTSDKVGFSQYVLDSSYKCPVFWDSFSSVFRTADGNRALVRSVTSSDALNTLTDQMTINDRGYVVYTTINNSYLTWNGYDWVNEDGSLFTKVRYVKRTADITTLNNIFSYSNVVYKIVGDIDLAEGTLTIATGSTLDFQGGSISNGIITRTSIGNTYLRPEWFGAKGDNSANDSAAFQMAINLCNSSNCKVLKLKEATYLIDDITIPSNISIIGADKYKSILKSYANPLNTPILKSDDAQGNNIVLRNLTIESAGERTEYTVKILNKVGVIIDNCYFVRHVVGSTPNDFHGIFIGRKEGTETTYVTKFTNNRVNQCCVTIEGTDGYIDHNEIWGIGCKSALHLIKSGNHMISNNQIVGGSVYGAIYCTEWATALKIFGNYFDGSSTAVANVPFGINVTANLTYSIISNNNFWHLYGVGIKVTTSIGNTINGNVFENNDTADTGVSDIVFTNTQSGSITNNSFVRAGVKRINKAPVLDITGYDSTSYEPIVISGNIMRGYLNYAAASYNPLSSVIKSVNNGHQYFEYIKNNSPYRIFTSDGEVNYVSSADISSDPLASRVYTYLEGGKKPRLDNLTYVNAGNMPTSSKFDFSATYNKDFKLYIGSIHQVLNAPTWLTGGMWLENYYTDNNYCIQKIISSSTTYTRTCNNGTWSSWYKIEGTILT